MTRAPIARCAVAAIAAAALSVPFPFAAAAASPAPASVPSLATLRESYLRDMQAYRAAEMKKFRAQLAAAEVAGGGRPRAIPAMPMMTGASGPGAAYGPQFLAVARANPKAPDAVEALTLALQASGGPTAVSGTYADVMATLGEAFADHPGIGGLVRRLATDFDPRAAAGVRAVLEKNPDRKIQATACKSLLQIQEARVTLGRAVSKQPSLRANYEKSRGVDWTDALVRGLAESEREVERLKALRAERFASDFPDLSVGQPVPELVLKDLKGRPARLSDLKGRVVVLDIWATWCGPCCEMIPHERAMVERLKGRPFTLVSISADQELKTLTDFLAREPMPWTHWWNGSEGGVLEAWDIRFFPTIYVIDARGIIRHTGLRGEKLEEAVVKLLDEAAEK